MFGSTIFDTKDFTTRLDEVYKDDKQHKEDYGWDEHDLSMIAEGMLQAEQTLKQMQLEADREKKEYKEVKHGKWLTVDKNKDVFECSNCKRYRIHGCFIPKPRYCGQCGAKMDMEVLEKWL